MKLKLIMSACLAVIMALSLSSCKNKVPDDNKNIPTTPNTEFSTQTEPEPTESQTVYTPKTSDDINSYNGKTIGDLERDGFKYHISKYYGLIGSETAYTYYYEYDNIGYEVIIIMPEETQKALNELDRLDSDYDEKSAQLRSGLKIVEITPVTQAPVSEQELSKYIGKNASVLINDGFEQTGYTGINGYYIFDFSKDEQCYSVTFDESVNTYMEEKEFGDESYKTQILDCPIKSISYSKPDFTSIAYSVSYF